VLLGFIDHAHAAFENLPYDVVAELVLNREESHEPIFAIRVLKSSLDVGI
jgi:hypothetical protein